MVYQSRFQSPAFLEPHARKDSLVYLNALFSRSFNCILQKRGSWFELMLFTDGSLVRMNADLKDYLGSVKFALSEELGTDDFFKIREATIAALPRLPLYTLPELPTLILVADERTGHIK